MPPQRPTAIRMLALDVDGTLAASGDEVSPATRAALHRAAEADVEIVIATGRRYRSAARVIERLGLETAAVCLGGALVKETDRRTLHHAPFEPVAVAELVALLREAELTFVGQRDSHAHGGADFVLDAGLPSRDPIQSYVERNAEHAEWRDDLVERPPEDVLVVGSFGESARLERTARRLEEAHPGRFVTTLVPSPWDDVFYLEVVGAEVSKWTALERLATLRGLEAAAVCAVGDQLNDLSMVRGSGLGVAMGNAHESLKAVADLVCGRHDEDGLVDVVERIIAGR